MDVMIERVRAIDPDVVVLAGDLTTAGTSGSTRRRRAGPSRSSSPRWSSPAITTRATSATSTSSACSASRTRGSAPRSTPSGPSASGRRGSRSSGSTSSEPDVNEGRIGRDRYPWIAEQFDEPNDIRILAVHHHLVPIPGTGRERNIVLDAGDLLRTITSLDVDVVLCGHKHVPYFWGLNGMLLCNSGTAGRIGFGPRRRRPGTSSTSTPRRSRSSSTIWTGDASCR